MMQKLQRLIVGLLLTVFLAIGFSTPVYAQSRIPVESAGYIYRVNVSSADSALQFYRTILGMDIDERTTDCPSPNDRTQTCWLEFVPRRNPFVRIGTLVNPTSGKGTGSAVITIVVRDVDSARDYLRNNGIKVSPIQNAGKGVRLAFFTDFDGNSLAIRDDRGTI
jgi:catechol 2,3-dioxygenase-like lactoylglutathione lyase family enzyme